MIGDLQHQEALAQLWGTHEKVGARIEQVFDQRRSGLIDLLIKLRHADRREITGIRHLTHEPEEFLIVPIIRPVDFHTAGMDGMEYGITAGRINFPIAFRARIRYTFCIHIY